MLPVKRLFLEVDLRSKTLINSTSGICNLLLFHGLILVPYLYALFYLLNVHLYASFTSNAMPYMYVETFLKAKADSGFEFRFFPFLHSQFSLMQYCGTGK